MCFYRVNILNDEEEVTLFFVDVVKVQMEGVHFYANYYEKGKYFLD